MHADSLTSDLRNHLHWCVANAPEGRLRWVMDIDWFNEVRHAEDYRGFTLWMPLPFEDKQSVLGVPVDIREQDDRPAWMWRVPHLEAAS